VRLRPRGFLIKVSSLCPEKRINVFALRRELLQDPMAKRAWFADGSASRSAAVTGRVPVGLGSRDPACSMSRIEPL